MPSYAFVIRRAEHREIHFHAWYAICPYLSGFIKASSMFLSLWYVRKDWSHEYNRLAGHWSARRLDRKLDCRPRGGLDTRYCGRHYRCLRGGLSLCGAHRRQLYGRLQPDDPARRDRRGGDSLSDMGGSSDAP